MLQNSILKVFFLQLFLGKYVRYIIDEKKRKSEWELLQKKLDALEFTPEE